MVLSIKGFLKIYKTGQDRSVILIEKYKVYQFYEIMGRRVCLITTLSPMTSSSHMTRNCSMTLERNEVNPIGLRSSSVAGCWIFPNGVTYSSFHWSGQFADCTKLFNELCTGFANSTENSFNNVLGRSPGTPDWGFLAATIFL